MRRGKTRTLVRMADAWLFVRTWGSVIGLAFDIAGALLVYAGVRVTLARAFQLEDIPVAKLYDDLGSPEMIKKHERLNAERAAERVRASRWAQYGLALFLVGFTLQAIGSWPKS
jgi:hypothetical protein